MSLVLSQLFFSVGSYKTKFYDFTYSKSTFEVDHNLSSKLYMNFEQYPFLGHL